MAEKVPIVVGEDGIYTRATSETFRKLAEGHKIAGEFIVWVFENQAIGLLEGKLTLFLLARFESAADKTHQGTLEMKAEERCSQCGCTHATSYELGRRDERLAARPKND